MRSLKLQKVKPNKKKVTEAFRGLRVPLLSMSPAAIICVASTNASTTTEQWVSANSKHRVQTAMLKPLKLGAKHTLLPLVSHRYFGTAAKAQLTPYVYVIFPEPDFPKRFRRRGTAAKTTGGHRLDVFSL